MPHQNLTIRTSQDLARLLDRRNRYRDIQLLVAGLPEPQRRRWQDELAQHYSGCGCGVGNIFGLIGVGAAGLYLTWTPVAAQPWLHGSVAFGLVAVFASAGTLAGQWRARRRVRAAVSALSPLIDRQRALAPTPAHEHRP